MVTLFILKEFCVSYYQQLNLFLLTYLSIHSDFYDFLHAGVTYFKTCLSCPYWWNTAMQSCIESEGICGKLFQKSCWTTFHFVISSLFQLLIYIFHWPNISGSQIYIWISSVSWILRSQGCSLKLLERIQLDKPSSLVKSSKCSLVNSWWIYKCTWWPSILIFDWLEFYLIHCVSQSSLLDICLNAIHFLFKSLFLTACDSLIITFTFPSFLEQAWGCWKILYHTVLSFLFRQI